MMNLVVDFLPMNRDGTVAVDTVTNFIASYLDDRDGDLGCPFTDDNLFAFLP